jgi:hypothetical protein
MSEELIEPFSAQEFFIDGFAEQKIVDGIFSCVGYRLHRSCKGRKPIKVVVMRIVMPATSAIESNFRTRQAIVADTLEIGAIASAGRH